MNAKVIVGVIGGVLLVAVGSWVFSGTSELRRSLEEDGYSDISLTRRGLFDFGFEGTHHDQHCVGSIDRGLLTLNRQEMCMSRKRAEPAEPSEPRHEVLASNVTKMLHQFPIESMTCDPLADDDTSTTVEHCHAECEGSTLELTLNKVGDQWKLVAPQRVYYRPTLAQELSDGVTKKVGKVTEVSCGQGLLGFHAGDELTCDGTRTEPQAKKAKAAAKKKKGQVKVTFAEDGAYTWSATF